MAPAGATRFPDAEAISLSETRAAVAAARRMRKVVRARVPLFQFPSHARLDEGIQLRPLRHLCKGNQDLHRLKGHRDASVFGAFYQAQFLQAGDVGMNVGVVALGCLGECVDAAWTYATQCVQQVKPRGNAINRKASLRFSSSSSIVSPWVMISGCSSNFPSQN